MKWRDVIVVAGSTLMTLPVLAQPARLQSRLEPATYAAVSAIIDSARKAGLPTKPIEDKALEGAGAGATGPQILSAVRTYTVQLGEASTALGKSTNPGELRAAVGAIAAGVPPRDLVRMRQAAPKDRSIATALTVLGDIVMRGVPVANGTNLVVSLVKARVKDPQILDFDRAVRTDISGGADPTTAASARAKGTIITFGSPGK